MRHKKIKSQKRRFKNAHKHMMQVVRAKRKKEAEDNVTDKDNNEAKKKRQAQDTVTLFVPQDKDNDDEREKLRGALLPEATGSKEIHCVVINDKPHESLNWSLTKPSADNPTPCSSQNDPLSAVIKEENEDFEYEDVDTSEPLLLMDETGDDGGNNENKQEVDDFSYDEVKAQFLEKFQSFYSGKKLPTTTPYTRETVKEAITEIQSLKNVSRTDAESSSLLRNFEVIEQNDTMSLIVRRQTPSDPLIPVVAGEDCFDILKDAHISTEHGGHARMISALENKYSVPKVCIHFFLTLCNVCAEKKRGETDKPVKQTKNMVDIFSKPNHIMFNIAVQVSIIKMPHPDKKYKYLLVYIDLGTNYLLLRPLESYDPTHVSIELLKIFLDFGPPKRLHAQNDKYFTNVMKLVLLTWPECKISVVSAYKSQICVLEISRKIKEWMKKNSSKNWTMGCYFVQWEMNNTKIGGVTPYQAVFNRDSGFEIDISMIDINIDIPPASSNVMVRNVVNEPSTSHNLGASNRPTSVNESLISYNVRVTNSDNKKNEYPNMVVTNAADMPSASSNIKVTNTKGELLRRPNLAVSGLPHNERISQDMIVEIEPVRHDDYVSRLDNASRLDNDSSNQVLLYEKTMETLIFDETNQKILFLKPTSKKSAEITKSSLKKGVVANPNSSAGISQKESVLYNILTDRETYSSKNTSKIPKTITGEIKIPQTETPEAETPETVTPQSSEVLTCNVCKKPTSESFVCIVCQQVVHMNCADKTLNTDKDTLSLVLAITCHSCKSEKSNSQINIPTEMDVGDDT